MKKQICCMLVLLLLFSLAGCGGSPAPDGEAPVSEPETALESASALEPEPEPEPEVNVLDLTGQWKEVGPESEDAYYGAVIGGDKIELHRVSDGGGTRYLYWAGTYVPPETEEETYAWTSLAGYRRTDREAIAAAEESKGFDYEGGRLSCTVKDDGTERTLLMERKEWEPGLGISNVPDELKSGFDPATNQTYTIGGVTFSFPAYFNIQDEAGESADFVNDDAHFYPEGADTHCSLMFWTQVEESLTQKKFDATKADYNEFILRGRAEDIAVIESRDAAIAGLSGWMTIFRDHMRDEQHSTTCKAFAFNPANKELITIVVSYTDGDMSGYDYTGDFQKILDSAQLAS